MEIAMTGLHLPRNDRKWEVTMILIIGGAHQGKLEFAKETYGLTEEDIHICGTGDIDFSKRCIYGVEEFTWNHPDPKVYFMEQGYEGDQSVYHRRAV